MLLLFKGLKEKKIAGQVAYELSRIPDLKNCYSKGMDLTLPRGGLE